MTLIQACNDDQLFGRWFRNGETWVAWFALIAALFGLPMTAEQRAIYQRCTGRTSPSASPVHEAWLICGRRAGKSFILALIAVYLATFRDWRPLLAPGERGTIMVIATDRRQARVILRYIRALILEVPMLAALVERETAESFDLSNAATIEVASASFRSTRGYTIIAALCDELAFWSDENAAEPDYEVLNALRPGMATIPDGRLLCASSPYAPHGALADAHRAHFAKEGDPVLVWQADTRTMNPSVPQAVIDRAYERDPASAAAEYGAVFRKDVASFISREIVEAAVDLGVHERGPIPGVRYYAFTDPSGGASDAMTLAISHREDRVLTLDAVREYRPPFSPEAVVAEFAALLKRYRITELHGDRYAGDWPRERFSQHGIAYRVSDRTKSDIFRDVLPELNSRNVALLDNGQLVAQLCGLERRTARGGRDVIDHSPNAHDDIANAVCGALLLATPRVHQESVMFLGQVGGGGFLDCLTGEIVPPLSCRHEVWQ